MIHCAEAVLPGHPDKFCDRVADAIVAEALAVDPAAFAQIEVGVWSDQAWLSGTIVTRKPLAHPLRKYWCGPGWQLAWTPATMSTPPATG